MGNREVLAVVGYSEGVIWITWVLNEKPWGTFDDDIRSGFNISFGFR